MNQYKFEAIIRDMGRRFGKIPRGQEDQWNAVFFVFDSNVLKIHRQVPSANDYRLREGLILALHTIRSRIDDKADDLSNFENEENKMLRDAILTACDPYSNAELMAVVVSEHPEMLEKNKEALFSTSVRCIVRMIESVDFWTNYRGINGYFDMVEDEIGNHVTSDAKMLFLFQTKKGRK